MRTTIKAALAGLVLLSAASSGALAASHATTIVQNNSNDSVWITYYNVTKNHIGTDCVRAHKPLTATWDWTAVTGSEGGIYFRFEYKQNTDCGGKTLYDSHYGGLYKMPALGQTLSVSIPAR